MLNCVINNLIQFNSKTISGIYLVKSRVNKEMKKEDVIQRKTITNK